MFKLTDFQRKIGGHEFDLSQGLNWVILRHDEKSTIFPFEAKYTIQDISKRYICVQEREYKVYKTCYC